MSYRHRLDPLFNVRHFQKNPMIFFRNLAKKNEQIVPFHLLSQPCFLVSDPELIHEILLQRGLSSGSSAYLRSGRGMNVIEKIVGGDSILTTEGEKWKEKRKIMAPIFHQKMVATFTGLFVEQTQAVVDRWSDADLSVSMDVEAEMTELSMQNACLTLFGSALSGSDRAAISAGVQVVNEYFGARFSFPLPLWLPTPLNRRFRLAVRRMNEVTGRLINAQRSAIGEDGENKSDVLSILMQSRDGEKRITDAEIHSEVLTSLLAGHGTSAAALTWIWYMLALSEHAPYAERLYHELNTVLGDRPITVDDLPHLPYLSQVVSECLRLWPPVWFSFREAAYSMQLAERKIPMGAMLFISPYLLHRNTRFWGDRAEEFDPDHFAPEFRATLSDDIYIPFLTGPHICIGQSFALLQLHIIVGQLFRSFSFRIVPERLPTPVFLSTLVPESGMWLYITPRNRGGS